MKAIDIINELYSLGAAPEVTCDTVKAGDVQKEIKKVAVTMFPSIKTVREACEWQVCEYVRDAAELGINKSVIVMGHVGSERNGMRLLCEKLVDDHSDIQFKYFENEEVYSYTN